MADDQEESSLQGERPEPESGEPTHDNKAGVEQPRDESHEDPSDSKSKPDDNDLEPQLKDMQRRTDHYYYSTYNTVFNAEVGAGVLTIGDTADGHGPRTASVDDADVRLLLEHFATPPAHADASAVLDQHHLVFLSGDAQTGRRCGAIALLAQLVPGGTDGRAAIVEFAPGCTTSDLLSHPFEPGSRYVLTEYSPGDVTDEVMRFDLEELCRRLMVADSFVVATTSTPAARFNNFAITWSAVDCRDVLDAYLHTVDRRYDEPTVSRLRNIAEHRRPIEMRSFFELLEREGCEAVEQHFQDGARNNLRELIAGAPCVPTLLPLVAAAFLPGALEGRYELHLDQLRELVDVHAHRDPATRAYSESLEQSRELRAAWVTARTHPFLKGERVVELIGMDTGEVLLEELRRRYGRELWKPVHDWLTERPREISDVGDERALAVGMATLARVDPAGAYIILDKWAEDGSLAGLWAAAATVSALCRHESTVGDALDRAARWTQGIPKKKVAAALSFGQTLGRAFPVTAMSYLWFLSLREAAVSRPARNQFAALIRAASRDDDRVRRALSIVEWQLEQVLLDYAHDEPLIGKALETVSTVLSADLPGDESLTQHVLHHLPDQIRRVGSLWAEVLRSWEHRNSALEHLHATYEALGSDGVGVFAALGESVRRRLEPAEWQWVCRDLAVEAWTPTMRVEVPA